jgi:hypothetical protein
MPPERNKKGITYVYKCKNPRLRTEELKIEHDGALLIIK